MPQNFWIRICWLGGLSLLAVPIGLRLFVAAVTPARDLRDVVDYIFDDGYYYLTVATNLVESGRSTFDGISLTNGYQPLWLLMLTGLAAIVGTQPYPYFIACCALVYAIAVGTPLLVLFWPRGDRRHLMFCAAIGLIFAMLHYSIVFLRGLEPILFVPVLVIMVALIERDRNDSRTLLQISTALAVAFLIRLDSLALFASVLMVLQAIVYWRERPKRSTAIRSAVRMAAQTSLVLIPTVLVYAAINFWLFGSPVPVSGLAKLVGGVRFTNWGAAQTFLQDGRILLVMLAVLTALEYCARRLASRPSGVFYRSIAIVSVAAALQSFYYAAFSTWYVWPWYTYLIAADVALVVARIIYLANGLLATSARPSGLPRAVAFVVLAFVGAWTSYESLALISHSLPSHTKAKLLAGLHRSPPATELTYNQVSVSMLEQFFSGAGHTTIGMGDRSGGLSYWGRGRVSIVQTEGLLLDIGYIRARVLNRGAEYLERFPIEYLVVDREVVPRIADASGASLYVVPDPIQGRVSFDPVPTFCFPPNAVRYEQAYTSTFHSLSKRMAFLFVARVPCTDAATRLVRSIEMGVGLRQYSLPSDYDPAKGERASKPAEDRDRRYALGR